MSADLVGDAPEMAVRLARAFCASFDTISEPMRRAYIAGAAETLAALKEAGYVIVPREPTAEMIEVPFHRGMIRSLAPGEDHRDAIRSDWRAMVDAYEWDPGA